MSKENHATFAPSAAHRWMNCKGCVNLCKNAPPQKESKYAIEGTNAHECLQFLMERFSNLPRAIFQAKEKWPEEMVEHAVNSALKIFDMRPSPEAKLSVESRVTLDHISKRLYGRLDYSWVEEWGKLIIIDFKYGAGHVVNPEENPQLLVYAVGVAKKYNYEFDEVKLAIIQPRVQGFPQWTTTIKRLQEFERELKSAIQEANKPDAELTPGDWCRWCPAITICPAVSKTQMVKADIVFDVETGIEAAPDPKGLTSSTLPKVLDACDILEKWIEAVRDHAFQLAESGEKIKGRVLVPKRPQRVWLPRAEALAKKQFGSMAFKTEFLSPAQLEKSLGKNGAKNFIEKNSSEVSSGLTLVREVTPKATSFDLDTRQSKA